MTDGAAPRVFISHGSEDKNRFVMPFARRLRAQGVEAWVDRWEIRSGDSLVQKIFDEGIAGADAFVIVLSVVSVVKPWVREELDATVVRRIESRGERRIIPVILDEEVVVPAPLQHLLWESVPRDGLDGVTENVVHTVFNRDIRPPLGEVPAFTRVESRRWTGAPADDVVLELIIELWRGLTPETMAFSNDVEAAAATLGIGREQFHESMHALVEQRLVNAQVMAGGLRWWLKPLPDRVWLRVEMESGVDVDALRLRLLSLIVNEGATSLDPANLGINPFTVGAILREYDSQRLMTVHMVSGGIFVVSGVSPLARRALRN